mmetsp:Transcript_15109/g.17497  ORF Transcript_15109/g.17497 Transcript_15109/m.17497 type:complete len:93 (+) Transcript_15109:1023-1301(+)
MFLQPPIVHHVMPKIPDHWNPTMYKMRKFEVPDKIYAPFNPNLVQPPVVFNYGQNAGNKMDSDEPVSDEQEPSSEENPSSEGSLQSDGSNQI